MFNAQVVALLKQYRVLVWDARGHGKSQPGGVDISLEHFTADIAHIDARRRGSNRDSEARHATLGPGRG